MAQEEITIIEEEDAAGVEIDSDLPSEDKAPLPWYKQRKFQLLLGGGVLLFVLLIIVLILVLKKEPQPIEDFTQEVHQSLEKQKPVTVSSLERLIRKANVLYEQGHRQEALRLFEQIAIQSESISFYNLGVTRMKSKQYDQALDAFKKAITQNENITISATNAAVCAVHLNKPQLFDYYIKLAKSTLDEQFDSPLYSYFKALIFYYDNMPLETLMTLNHPTSTHYEDSANYLKAKSAYAVGDVYESIDNLQKNINEEDFTTLGMLYARVGELELAKKALKKALESGYNPILNTVAMAHVLLKKGEAIEAGKLYKLLYDQNKKGYTEVLPIKVFLAPQQFDIKAVQHEYMNSKNFSTDMDLHIIMHYAPFKTFNAAQTVEYIKKGSANIYIDDIQSAQTYLQKGTRFSKINKTIAKAIVEALQKDLHKARLRLEAMHKIQPKHSILNYNLALIYAKLGDFSKAHELFVQSYHQDAKNFLAGAFAVMTGDVIGKSRPKLKEIVKENLEKEAASSHTQTVSMLFDFYGKQYSVIAQKSQDNKPNTLMDEAVLLLSFKHLGQTPAIQAQSQQLLDTSSDDFVSHMLFIHSHYRTLSNKDFAIKSLHYIDTLSLKLNDIFYGSYASQDMFIQLSFISGRLFDLMNKLKSQHAVEQHNVIPITQALAKSYLYLGMHEKAFVLYNQLIDEFDQKDSTTLFNAALAATAANHHANAIVLLELANLKNRYNQQSRYALGLLYLEDKNYNAANIQLGYIKDPDFTSKHFNFDIDTDDTTIASPY